MKHRNRIRTGALWMGFAAVTTIFAQSGAARAALPEHIPPVKGTVLAGQQVELPEALRGRVGVIVLSFSQASREEVTAWGRRLGGDYYGSQSVAYYELAMLAEVPRLLRGYVTRKIKEQVSPHGQEHFLPVGDHEDEWKAVAGYAKPDDAYVILVDGNGTVRWRTSGALSDAAYAQLAEHLRALAAH